MVKSAYSSGTPAYGVGVGNPVIIVAEDADLSDAATKISISKTFDNATSCSSENSLVIHDSVFEKILNELKNHGAYLCNSEEKVKLERWMWKKSESTESVVQNSEVVAQSARKIAEDAGFDVPKSTQFLMVLGKVAGVDQFSGEKISPVIALWKYQSFDEALEMVREMHKFAGQGHSAGLYTFNQNYIQKAATSLNVSRVLVRQAHAPSAGGNLWNGMPSTVTMGCGTWGGNITTENIHWKHFINVTWLAEPIEPGEITDEAIFGSLWEKYGK
jgi:sulfoacetaldehyde dehydrogenase